MGGISHSGGEGRADGSGEGEGIDSRGGRYPGRGQGEPQRGAASRYVGSEGIDKHPRNWIRPRPSSQRMAELQGWQLGILSSCFTLLSVLLPHKTMATRTKLPPATTPREQSCVAVGNLDSLLQIEQPPLPSPPLRWSDTRCCCSGAVNPPLRSGPARSPGRRISPQSLYGYQPVRRSSEGGGEELDRNPPGVLSCHDPTGSER